MLAESGGVALAPQVRLRNPLFHNRLVTYVVGGADMAFTDFNDRKPRKLPIEGPEGALPSALRRGDGGADLTRLPRQLRALTRPAAASAVDPSRSCPKLSLR
jgi:hypothetical protein